MAKEAENIAKIRELLFGNNLTELELRFNKTEASLNSEISKLEEKYTGRLEALKADKLESNEFLSKLVQTEKTNRESEIAQLQGEIQQLKALINTKEEHIFVEINSLKQKFADQQQIFENQQKKSMDELKAHLEGLIGDLRQSKVERSALAVLFSEVAMHLVDKGNITAEDEPSESIETN